MHSLVNLFRKSSIKNEIRQKYAKPEHGKELTLIKDCNIMWNSILAMIDRFLLLQKTVSKALLDLSTETNLSEDDFVLLKEPLKLGSIISARFNMDFC